MGKIVKDKYPELDDADQEAVRQHAIAALNLNQGAKELVLEDADSEEKRNTALIEGVRKFCMDVRELDIDLIDRINPFAQAYAILGKSMNEDNLRQIAAVISARKSPLTLDEARELAQRALKFKRERHRLPSLDATDPWERRMAEGVSFLSRMQSQQADAAK